MFSNLHMFHQMPLAGEQSTTSSPLTWVEYHAFQHIPIESRDIAGFVETGDWDIELGIIDAWAFEDS